MRDAYAVLPHKRRLESQQGISFVEILVVVAITLLLAVAAVPIVGNLQKSSQLNTESVQVIQTLRTAKERATAGLRDANHGVYFEPDRYTLYQGSSYAARDANYDRVLTLHAALTLSNDFPGNEVNFSKGFGKPDTIGTVILTHNVQGTKTITVNIFGMVEE
jgi:Tfp pilus assembly protein FimT